MARENATRIAVALIFLVIPRPVDAQDLCNDVLRYGTRESMMAVSQDFFLARRSWICEETGRREERLKNVAGQANIPVDGIVVGGKGNYTSESLSSFFSLFCSEDLLMQKQSLRHVSNVKEALPQAITAWNQCMTGAQGILVAGLKLLEDDNRAFQISVRYHASQEAPKTTFILDPKGIRNADCSVIGAPPSPTGRYSVTSSPVEITCTKTDPDLASSVILAASGLAFTRPEPPTFVVPEKPKAVAVEKLEVEALDVLGFRDKTWDGAGLEVLCTVDGVKQGASIDCDWPGDGVHTGCWERPARMTAMCQAKYGHGTLRRGKESKTLRHKWKVSQGPAGTIRCEIQRNGAGEFVEVKAAPGWPQLHDRALASEAACILANPSEMQVDQTTL